MNHKSFAKKMNNYTVLYVEDDLSVRQYIAEFLRRYCKEVYESDSAEEAIVLYHKHQPDILLLDINLGGMSGVEFAEYVRQKDKKTRILISTAYSNKEFMLAAIELNLTRYLIKPVTNEDLVKAFEKCSDELEEASLIELGKGYVYSKNRALVIHEENEMTLRNKEVEILEYFLEHEDEVVRYEQLEQGIWQDELMSRDAIRSQIRNIRKKVPAKLFQNISGLGYKFSRNKDD
ncbi:MAG: Regulator [uncultured Sulfurovum sp.]|uniref:Regulator n=1 Tax=uncultured Sulfurovum sp. TaxID=269237 RepID=A0A6S6TNL2_9BACT|nr:MAG: Regulator [uncultured Sulfurovum sp.]